MFVNGSGRNVQSLWKTFHRYFLPSFDLFGQAVSEERIFKNEQIRNKNCLCRPCLLMDRDKMSNLYRGPSIDASYQVLVNRRQMPIDGKSSRCLWQGELKTNCSSLIVLHTCLVFRSRWSGWPYTMYRPSFLYSFLYIIELEYSWNINQSGSIYVLAQAFLLIINCTCSCMYR